MSHPSNITQNVAQSLRQNPRVRALVQEFNQIVREHAEKITRTSPPEQEDLIKQNAHLVEQIAQARGRGMLYPHVASGLGNGPYMEFCDGSVVLDFVSAIGVNILGHNHPAINAALINAALGDVVMQGNLQLNTEYAELSHKMSQLAQKNSRLKHCWISPSGSMSNENALKMLRQKNTPKRKIVAMCGAFAGRTTMMAAITDNPSYKIGLPTHYEEDILRVQFPHTAADATLSLKQLRAHISEHGDDIAAFTFEPVLGEGGFWTTSKEHIEPLLQLCKKHGIGVWLDEVQTFARTGELFAFESLGIGEYVDVCTVGKALQNCATLFTPEYAPGPGLVAGTFASSTGALAAGVAVLDELTTKNYLGPGGRIKQIEKLFTQGIADLTRSTGLISHHTKAGLMHAFQVGMGDAESSLKLVQLLFKNGLLVYRCGRGPFRLRILVPAVATDAHINEALGILEQALLELKPSV